jgi:DNA-binding PadR family transcriptional regulator
MEEAGFIRASWIDKEKGKRSRVYALTADGRKQLAADEERWTTVAGAVLHVLKHA